MKRIRRDKNDEARKRRYRRIAKIAGGLAGRYRALMIGAVVVVAALFGNDLIRIIRLEREIARQQRRKAYYEEMIRQDSTVLRSLEDNRQLERLAREKYLMRRPGEQIYIVKRPRKGS